MGTYRSTESIQAIIFGKPIFVCLRHVHCILIYMRIYSRYIYICFFFERRPRKYEVSSKFSANVFIGNDSNIVVRQRTKCI